MNDDDDGLAAPRLKQGRIDVQVPLSQHMLDQYIVDYIVQSILPVHHVDSSDLKSTQGG